MKTVREIYESLQSLCSGPRHRRRARRLSQSGDGLESRQLMTALIGGFYESEGNNSAAQANDLPVSPSMLDDTIFSRALGSVGGLDSQDFFRLELDERMTNARITLTNLTANLNIQLQNSSGRVLASGTRSGYANEILNIPTLAAGTYFIRIYRASLSASSNYVTRFSATPSGSSVVPPTTPTPPTSPTPPSLTGDFEPNNSRLMAGSVGSLTSGVTRTVSGSVTGGDREDWYRVPVGANGSLQIDLTGMTADLDVEVQDSSGNVVGSSTNSSSRSEQIRLTGLSSGDYFVRIYRFSTAGSGYRLSTLVRTGTPVTPPAPTPPPVIVGVDGDLNDSMYSASPFGTIRSSRTTSVTGSLVPDEADDWFELSLSEASSLSVNLSLSNARSRLLNRCDHSTHIQVVDSMGFVLADTTPPFTNVSRGGTRTLNLSSLPAGRYYLRVFRTQTGLASPYTLTATPRSL